MYRNEIFVATKQLTVKKISAQILQNFFAQLDMLKTLRLHHVNIVMLFGRYLDDMSGKLYVILEWCGGGSYLIYCIKIMK